MGIEQFHKKLLDRKKYFCVDPRTGKPQLIRLEPVFTEAGDVIPEVVKLYVDDVVSVMERDAAEIYLASLDAVPEKSLPQWWKHQKEN